MSILLTALLTLPCVPSPANADQLFSMDSLENSGLPAQGPVSVGNGAKSKGFVLNGQTVLTVPNGNTFGRSADGFTLQLWFNPYLRDSQQQVLAARSRYSLNEREWTVMVDRDGHLRLYVWQGKWVTAQSATPLTPGHWYQLAVVRSTDRFELWMNGESCGKLVLQRPVPVTQAPLTLGAVNDNGRIWQQFTGVLDEVTLTERALSAEVLREQFQPVAERHDIPQLVRTNSHHPDPAWNALQQTLALEDQTTVLFDGQSPNRLACDTTLRRMPDGSLVMIMLGNGDTEPLPANRVLITRSIDHGVTWSGTQPIDLGVKDRDPTTALVPSELMVHDGRATLFVATHDGTFAEWREWMTTSDDSGRTWGPLTPAPGRLQERTFIRNHIVTADGRLMLPFQHYQRVATTRKIHGGRRFSPPTDPRNGVLISNDGGETWSEHGNIRLTTDDDYSGWAENNIVELSGGRIGMIIRGDRLGGVLYYAESPDGGITWPDFARRTGIPNPGSKATLYSLGSDRVALLHNPNPSHRSPLSLWISFDGMQTWPWQRVLVPESVDGPGGRLNYPDGFVTPDKRWLDFAYDDNRHRAVRMKVRLPDPAALESLAEPQDLPANSGELPIVRDTRFHVIKAWEPERDKFRWLHGVALAWHQDRLFCVFGHNTGAENTQTEIGRWCVSDDDGRTWSTPQTVNSETDAGDPAVSHGVLLNHEDRLWAFLGAFHGTRKRVHTRAFQWDPDNQEWIAHGLIIDQGFWPMNQPVRMTDGNWIMPGFIVGQGNPSAIAISNGDDLLKWKVVKIPLAADLRQVWGESALIVGPKTLTSIGRYGAKPLALMSRSEDLGKTWTAMTASTFPMTTSKPAAGMLSTGQRFLIASCTADGGTRRSPLTISLSRPGETQLSRTLVIRHAQHDGPGESDPNAALSYPYAVEHQGRLYVGYSNSNGRGGNHNSAELAVIPLSSLQE